MQACRFIVTGKVQGVFFRASARDQARRLGLRGYAKNLPDGSVEVVAAGEATAVESLAAWLRHGPPMATVAEVRGSHLVHPPVEMPPGFEIA
ncbi:MAG: acylphosphatase [Luteimonas sp.]